MLNMSFSMLTTQQYFGNNNKRTVPKAIEQAKHVASPGDEIVISTDGKNVTKVTVKTKKK